MKFWQVPLDPGTYNVFIYINVWKLGSREDFSYFFISTWTLIEGNRKELLDLSVFKLLKSK